MRWAMAMLTRQAPGCDLQTGGASGRLEGLPRAVKVEGGESSPGHWERRSSGCRPPGSRLSLRVGRAARETGHTTEE